MRTGRCVHLRTALSESFAVLTHRARASSNAGRQWDRVCEWDFHAADIKWFSGAKLNVSVNCLDRHIDAGHGDLPCMTFEADDGSSTTLTYNGVCRCRCLALLADAASDPCTRPCVDVSDAAGAQRCWSKCAARPTCCVTLASARATS